jgi:DNA mismatch repair protein MutS
MTLEKPQKMSVIEEYFQYQNDSVKKYGKKTIVFMEVGSFYEAYATHEQGYDLLEISKLINVIRTKKNNKDASINIKNPYMLGFPKTSVVERLNILNNNYFTIVLVNQITYPPKKVIRQISGVYTAGTNILSYSSNNNYITSLYIKNEPQLHGKNIISIGMTTCDVSTGIVFIHESYSIPEDDKLSLEQTSKFIQTYSPKEIIIYSDNSVPLTSHDYLKTYFDIDSISVKFLNDINKKYFKLSYQNDVIGNVYTKHGIITPLEYVGIERMTYATISFIMLLDYINSINSQILLKLCIPKKINNDNHLHLENNALTQLNIFSNSMYDTFGSNITCLFDIVNKTSTAMGKRYLTNMLKSPFIDINKIQNIYDVEDEFKNSKLYKSIDEQLSNIDDIEKIYRKMVIQTITPTDLYGFIKSLKSFKELYDLLHQHEKILDLLNLPKNLKRCEKIIQFCEKTFVIDNLKINTDNQNMSFRNSSYYHKNVHEDLDKIYTKIDNKMTFIKDLCNYLSSLLGKSNMITIKKTDRDGYYFNITKIRAKILQEKLKELKKIKIGEVELNVNDIIFKSNPSGNFKISMREMETYSDDIAEIKSKLEKKQKKLFLEDMNYISDKYNKCIKNIITTVSKIDYYISNVKTCIKYSYSKPNIIEKDYGYVSCHQLRHPIIERIIDYEYVPHDITLGNNDLKGILLYGLNSSGKSSMMKALGISIIMAQCGMYVPAKNFTYSPYTAIFTRIFGHDNIFKQLSSFGVEMLELKNIWNHSDQKSLIIGDEVCRGTEQISGCSIVSATILKLSSQKASFIFATHLHEIIKLDSIKNIQNVKAFHLSVSYDEKNDTIIYDRILKDGNGEEIYGITVAKYIIQNSEFNELTSKIKSDIMGKDEHIVQPKQSKYNSQLYINKCSICDKQFKKDDDVYNLDTHHINHQKNCIDNNVVGKEYIKKNDKCNLVVVCRKCHNKIHNGEIEIDKYVLTSDGKRLLLKNK